MKVDSNDTVLFRQQFAERLGLALDKAGIPRHGRQTWLAEILDVAQPSARRWTTGRNFPELNKIVVLADKLGIRLEWLVSGRGPMTVTHTGTLVPVIPWQDLSLWLDPETRETIVPSDRILFPAYGGPDTFATTMQGTSMEPDIMDEDTVVVDPGHPCRHQDYVLVSGQAGTETIRKVLMEGGQNVLVLTNSRYPWQVDTERTRIIGKVIGKLRLYP